MRRKKGAETVESRDGPRCGATHAARQSAAQAVALWPVPLPTGGRYASLTKRSTQRGMHTAVSLTKLFRDEEESSRMVSRIEEAQTERLLRQAAEERDAA